jgi:parvulin-like peptidyl-prolyl isomerase
MNALALLLAATVAVSAPPKETVLATVNGDVITVQDLVDQFTKRHGGHAKFLGGEMEARTFLNILIEERLFIQEAYNIGLDQDPKVDEAVAEFERAKASELLIRKEIDEKAAPTPAEVRATWESSLNFLMQVRRIAVDTKEDADGIRSAILHGADVDALARDCSRDDSRAHGGLMRVNWGQFDAEWERAVFPLQPGEISPVITTPNGYEVVVVEDRIDTARPEFEKLASQIESVLRQRRTEDRKREFSDELWRKHHVALQPFDLRAPLDTVIATWDDGGKLTLGDAFTKEELRNLAAFPPVPAQRAIDARVRATINDPLVTAEAKERKLAQTPEIARAVAKVRETMMESTLFKQHILKDVTLSDAEIRAYYDAHRSEFREPEQRHVAHILLATEAEAKAVREKLAGGADFGQVARKQSRDAATALFDGKLGWITPDKVSPAFKEVLTMAAGDVSQPIRSDHGWHIIKVSEIKPMRQQALDEVQPLVAKRAREAKERAVQATWLEKLRVPAKIAFDEAAISRFVKANEFDASAAAPQHGMK